jgi:electron transfer flavoprotein beta subunit
MNILVCLKQILDPEIPAREFRVDPARREAERGNANLVTNIFCENALETALQFREALGDAKITVLSFGAATAEDSLRKALAMKADAAALVINDKTSNPEPLTVAQVLAKAIRKLGSFDLVWSVAKLVTGVRDKRQDYWRKSWECPVYPSWIESKQSMAGYE